MSGTALSLAKQLRNEHDGGAAHENHLCVLNVLRIYFFKPCELRSTRSSVLHTQNRFEIHQAVNGNITVWFRKLKAPFASVE